MYEEAIAVTENLIERKQLVDFATNIQASVKRDLGRVYIAGLVQSDDLKPVMDQPESQLPVLLEARAIHFAGQSNFKVAVEAANELTKLKNASDGQLYNAACIYSLAATDLLAGKIQATLSKTELETIDTWKASALDALEESVNRGWLDVTHARNDQDLTILRNEPRLEALLKELEARKID